MKKIFLFALCLAALASCGHRQDAAQQDKKVGGRYVPERKDDFAWENEYAAFRLYGPALLPENPSNGVDLWLKDSPALVVDSMYYRELQEGRPYHINYNGNLDCYKVGHAAGCGGLCIVADSQLYVGGPYADWEILEETADRFTFRLHYDSLNVRDILLEGDLIITAEAGQLLNKAQVVLRCPQKIRLPQLYVGPGIFLHDSVDNLSGCPGHGMIIYCEDALSDKQAAEMNFRYNGSTSQGRTYTAIVLPGADTLEEIDNTAMALKAYEFGDTLTYYFGGCWSQYHNDSIAFPEDSDWQKAVCKYAHGLK